MDVVERRDPHLGLRRSARRSRRQSRSAFGRRNAEERSGSAGRPLRSSQTASASVAPNESVISTHVAPGAEPKRAAAPRKSAKKRMSGSPSWAECLAGERERDRERVEDLRLLLDDHLRRPAADRVAVDQGDQQRDEDHPAHRLEERRGTTSRRSRDRGELRRSSQATSSPASSSRHGQRRRARRRAAERRPSARSPERQREPGQREERRDERRARRTRRRPRGRGSESDSRDRVVDGERPSSDALVAAAARPTRGRAP